MKQKNPDKGNMEKEIENLQKQIRDLTAKMNRLEDEQPKTSRSTGPRAEIMMLLKKYGKPMSVKEIAEDVGLAEATVSGYTLDLYKGGLLDRGRRIVQVSPTRRVRQLEYYIPGKKKKKWHYVD